MIDTEKAGEVIQAAIEEGWDFWSIDSSWSVRWGFEQLDGYSGECRILLDYKRATIAINPFEIDDMPHLWKVTAHELCHIVVVEFDLFFRVMCPDNREIADRVYDFARERTVTQLERVFLREHPYDAGRFE